jgi:hypothetical protein
MTSWKLGDRVEHDTFGPGMVLEVNDQHIVIRFDNHGRKRFASHLVQLREHRPKTAGASRPRTVTSAATTPAPSVSSPEQLIDLARAVHSEDSLNTFVSQMRRTLPAPSNPHVGITSGMRVQQFQNWLLDENAKHRLTDAQLLALMRIEFPLASGQVFVGDVETGLQHIAGIRAHYNRDGHHGASPISRGMPLSVSYGLF